MSIICGTDFSENAGHAADAAAALAARLNTPLSLVHVKRMLLEGTSHEAHDAVMASHRERLREEAERLRGFGATVEEVFFSWGEADEVLVQLAQQRQPSLLVVSWLERRAPARWLLGSVAERTAESSPVPTLVVRDAAPFTAWTRGDRPLKVFVGVDFTASSDAALRWVAELRQIGPCDVVAAYVDWPPQERSRLGVHGPLSLMENPPEVQRVLERDLKQKVAGLLGEEQVRILVHGGWGCADAPLIWLAAEAQADLIVVGTHQRRGLSAPARLGLSRHPARGADECRVRAGDRGRSHGSAAHPGVPARAGGSGLGCQPRLCRALCILDRKPRRHRPSGACSRGFPTANRLIGGYYQDFPTKTEHAELVAKSEAGLRALAPAESEAHGVKTEVEVAEELDTAKAICAAAERFNADVVCIGGPTRLGFTAKVLGSVSLAVLQGSWRPVLVVWPPKE